MMEAMFGIAAFGSDKLSRRVITSDTKSSKFVGADGTCGRGSGSRGIDRFLGCAMVRF